MDFSQFKAAMFDFDGTITNLGEYEPPGEMIRALFDLSCKMPIAFCTGRQLESFEKHGMEVILRGLSSDERMRFLSNCYLVAENGAIGYHFDVSIGQFVAFYQAKWPEKFVARDHFKQEMNRICEGVGDVYDNAHRVIVVMRTRFHDVADRQMDDVLACSGEIYERVVEYLSDFDAEYGEVLHVGNSGIGVVVCPADADKDRGIREFADYLRRERGLEIGFDCREIAAIGDNPQASGNDHWFLKGEVGTPFTVGSVTDDPRLNIVEKKNVAGSMWIIEQMLS